jgi:hypothetical protein
VERLVICCTEEVNGGISAGITCEEPRLTNTIYQPHPLVSIPVIKAWGDSSSACTSCGSVIDEEASGGACNGGGIVSSSKSDIRDEKAPSVVRDV